MTQLSTIQAVTLVGFFVGVASLVLLVVFALRMLALMRLDREERKAYFVVIKGIAESARDRAKVADDKATDTRESVRREISLAKAEVKEELKAGTAPHSALPALILVVLIGAGANVAALTALPAGTAPRAVGDLAAANRDAYQTYRSGDHAGALRAAEAVLRTDPGNARAHYVRGLSLRELGRADEAERALDVAADCGEWAATARFRPARTDPSLVGRFPSPAPTVRDRLR